MLTKHLWVFADSEQWKKARIKGLQAELQEARTGLLMGKKLEKARIYLAKGDYEWRFSLSATLFEFTNVSLPKTVSPGDESSDPLAWEAKVLERAGMSEEAIHTIDQLFRMFLKIRIGSGWSEEKAGLKAWIAKSSEH